MISQKGKLQINITAEYRCKNPQQITNKLNPTVIKRIINQKSSEIYPRNARSFQYQQINPFDI